MTPSPGPDDLPPELEDAVLAILDGEDGARDAALAALLRRHAQHAETIRGWLARAGVAVPAAPATGGAGAEADDAPLPRALGHYLLLAVLGRGGFGTVYRAEQQQGLDRCVAIKVLNPGLDSREFLARFAAERAALQRMDHPGIARLFDAGTTPHGRPFLVMELVDGPPLSKFCRQRHLPLRERLRLFLVVLDAMQHAHQKAVVHRDLSSNNVLVADPDGAPLPKVIDFGVAKSLAGPLLQGGAHTLQGTLLGTPEFMSPEQAAGRLDAVDTRGDVYSLGVQLYELLSDQLPVPGVVLRAQGLAGLAEVVRTFAPAKPSEVAPPGRRAELRHDLDNITMKAIAKAPDERYASVGEFAADLRRHLADEPVQVTPPTVWYRLRKYVRRHRARALLIAAGAAAVITTLLVLWQLLVYANTMQREADEQRRRSDQKANAGFRLLANEERLHAAIAAEQILPPPWPEYEAQFTAWLRQHGEPLREEYQKLQQTERELAARDASSPHGLPDEADRHLLAALRRLHVELAALVEAPQGALARTRTRLAFLRDVVQPMAQQHAAALAAAGEAIRRSDGNPANRSYRGQRLPPLPGLVSLGAEPTTGWWQFLDLATHARGYPLPGRDPNGRLQLGAGTGVVFVLLPAGRLTVGARRGSSGLDRNDEQAADNELGGDPVALDAFLIASTELTTMQWARLTGEAAPGDPMLPATDVDWHAASAALRRYGMSLPTEVQWEYACRAGTTTPWSWGENAAKAADCGAFLTRERVGGHRPNGFLLFDLHGNVAEWCADELLPYPDFVARNGDGLRARAQPLPEALRVVRGGAFHGGALAARSTARSGRPPTARDSSLGLRPVRRLDGP